VSRHVGNTRRPSRAARRRKHAEPSTTPNKPKRRKPTNSETVAAPPTAREPKNTEARTEWPCNGYDGPCGTPTFHRLCRDCFGAKRAAEDNR
jgi:hypothetical protein